MHYTLRKHHIPIVRLKASTIELGANIQTRCWVTNCIIRCYLLCNLFCNSSNYCIYLFYVYIGKGLIPIVVRLTVAKGYRVFIVFLLLLLGTYGLHSFWGLAELIFFVPIPWQLLPQGAVIPVTLWFWNQRKIINYKKQRDFLLVMALNLS